MGTIAEKLTYLNGTKGAIKTAIEAKGVTVGASDTFREYATRIGEITSGGGIDINGATEGEYVVDTGQTITSGDLIDFYNGKVRSYGKMPVVFNTIEQDVFTDDGATSHLHFSITEIDTNKFLLAYNNAGSYGKAVVLTVSGDTVSAGTEYQFWATGAITYPKVIKLATDTVFLAFKGSDTYGYCQILTVSGTTISSGTQYQYNGANLVQLVNACLIDTNKILLAYSGVSNYGYARSLTFDGTNLTIGDALTFRAAAMIAAGTIALCKVTTNVAFVGYYSSTTASLGAILTDTDLTLAAGTAVTVGRNSRPFAVLLDTNKILYSSVASSTGGHSFKILTISGTTISVGIETLLLVNAQPTNNSLNLIETNKALLTFYLGGMTICMGIWDNGGLKFGNKTTVSTALNEGSTIASAISGDKVITTGITGTYFGRTYLSTLGSCNPQGVAIDSGTETQTITCLDWR